MRAAGTVMAMTIPGACGNRDIFAGILKHGVLVPRLANNVLSVAVFYGRGQDILFADNDPKNGTWPVYAGVCRNTVSKVRFVEHDE